ncbi:heterokaryon incompatibility protein-domain-containing protein [Halenospora varia]|nr:heterokaryon incompatibility protein-domain-containing protein [Halenospora varia]
MASFLPTRLLGHINGNFKVFDFRNSAHDRPDQFDIITYTWGNTIEPYNCRIDGVDWNVTISKQKLEDIKRLMIKGNVQYLWVDCVCLNQEDKKEMDIEVLKMYQYYKSARMCYILMDMGEVWSPQEIVDDLKFIDHILYYMGGATIASEARLGENLTKRLSTWVNTNWTFPIDASMMRSAAIDMGVLNCYSTCIRRVTSLFNNLYFSRMWTFQEMLLGKNITMYGMNDESISCIGQLDTWMDLATDSKDKAYKLRAWITTSRVLRTASVNAILRVIDEDCLILDGLQTQVRGISSARTDIINGGPFWWYENHKGISNIFSAISIRPRGCKERRDIFRGLLGVFNGLFTPEEVDREIMGDDMEKISFAFFKQLSIKTGYAWTKLAISSKERGECDWIPVVANHSKLLTTDCFAAVVNLGKLKRRGVANLAKATAMTGLVGSPQKYMKILLNQEKENRNFQFVFRGCNCGKKVKTGVFSSEPIPIHDQPRDVVGDETGRILVQCATILGSIMDPCSDVVEYRRRLLRKLQPHWKISDPNAKPTGWEDRCVSGTGWENPNPFLFRVHNRSMIYRMENITHCGSRLENESTASISCTVRVNCGCTITAPFSLIFEAITAMEGSSLGGASATLEEDRIVLRDGLGLVQVGDVGRTFSLAAFGGDVDFHESYSRSCRSTKVDKPVVPKLPLPRGRVLVREEFTHGMTASMRDYGYVETGGSGNLLICRNNLMGQYKIIGVCIDEFIENKKGRHTVTIR